MAFLNIKKLSLSKIIPFLTLTMELLWIYPLLVWLGRWLFWEGLRPHLSLISYAVIGFFTLFISKAAIERNWTVKRTQLTVIVASVVLLIVLVRVNFNGGYGYSNLSWFAFVNAHLFPVVVAMLAGFYFIWRGIAISRENSLFEDIYRKFMVGFGGIVFLLVVWGLSGLPVEGIFSTVGIYAVSFFGVGLLTMSITNLETLSRALSRHQESIAAFRRRWLSMLGVMILSIITIGILITSVFWHGTLIHVLETMGRWLLVGITYLFYPVAFVATALYYIGMFFINLIAKKETTELNAIKLEDFKKIFEEDKDKTQGFHLPPELLLALKWLLVAIVIGLIIFFLARILTGYWRSRMEEGVEEESESLWSWKVFKTDLKNFLFFMFPWLRRRKKRLSVSLKTDIETEQYDPDKIMTVRELYRSLLRRGRIIGIPRRESETPYEYSRRLSEKHGDVTEELDSLTGAYVYERYGEVTTGQEKVSWLNRIWRTLSSRLLNIGSNTDDGYQP